jgi:hypothetical protein
VTWQPLDRFHGGVSLAGEIDPMHALPHHLDSSLKLNTLLWGTILIPETHLLHHRGLFEHLRNDRARSEFEQFIMCARPVISRRSDAFNTSFASHWQASKETNNPLLIPGVAGEEFAAYLDSVVTDSQCRSFVATDGFNSFPTRFASALRTVFSEQRRPREGCESLLAHFFDESVARGDPSARDQYDKFSNLTRGRVIHGISRLVTDSKASALYAYRPQIMEAARLAYWQSVMDSLQRQSDVSAQLPLLSETQAPGIFGFVVRTDVDLVHELQNLLDTQYKRSYAISGYALRATPWETIVACSRGAHRIAFERARNEAIRLDPQQAPSEYLSRIEEMVRNLDMHLNDVQGQLVQPVSPQRRLQGGGIRA